MRSGFSTWDKVIAYNKRESLRTVETISRGQLGAKQVTMAAPGPLYACAGERVTCENGHYICTVARDIVMGAFAQRGEFMDWCFGGEPEIGKPPPPCQCGAPWWQPGQKFHFDNGGWR